MARAVRVVVLGSGSWGTTIASLSARNTPTTLWARNDDIAREIDTEHRNRRYLGERPLPQGLRATSDLEEAAREADVLVVGVPSHAVRKTLEQVVDEIRAWVPVVSLVEGLEPGTRLRPTEVIAECLPGHPVGLLAGPNIAGEIADGMAEGLSVGDNTRAMVLSRGLAEMTRLGEAMGADPRTFAGLTGMGDLIATCTSPSSRNRRVGEALARGLSIDEAVEALGQVAEGVKTAPTVMELAREYGVEMPIAAEVAAVVTGKSTPTDAYRGLRRVTPGDEKDIV
ncbi:glycerol-3-phosphate dehydrogenase [nad(p)+] [Rhodococcus rhodochrous]|uniref:NAD(P)H-dependent glycerol-3-phosphate dehydrogenase n=1 Tax=Rhodococcus rhodochrous TaxID=1829 RepID=UPI000751637C|nr:NAD(P)H-dependent glycerol-3-phosphate dehydrogenase [Rhodococcus rhodochrous]MDO1484554.1 NAD(P)-binding domain-containing protein [Rhodococcus rhodochrous]SNV27630.1 glycerol-3-phosphate dehydrogenase [nad(p)+] [Rhodococcus rhodochrous]